MAKRKQMFDSFGMTDTGLRRSSNQDQLLIADLRKTVKVLQSSLDTKPRRKLRGSPQGRLLLVADGMGGMSEGARASALVAETFLRYAVSVMSWAVPGEPADPDEVSEELVAAAQRCRRRLEREVGTGSPGRSMGSTLTVAYIVWPELYVLHVGDSRCYLCRDGLVRQLTTDHTIARRLAEEGAMDETAAANSPYAHVLWNSISNAPASELQPQVSRLQLLDQDVLVLCTDGLTRHVPDKRICEVACQAASARVKVETLVADARAGGGADNISVIVSQRAENS